MKSHAQSKSQHKPNHRGSQEVLNAVSRLVADDVPIADLFSRLASLLNDAVGPACVELFVNGQESHEYRFGSTLETDRGASMTLPLLFHTQKLGSINVVRKSRAPFSPDDIELLQTCAAYVAIRLNNVALMSDRDHFEELAGLDPLTGISGRREFDAQFDAEWRRGIRHGGPLSILLIDMDDLKEYNDRYGHVAGDACLQKIATTLDTCAVRPGDTVARFGGDEFAIVLPETDHAGAIIVAEKLRAAVLSQRIESLGGPLGIVTISVGVATELPAHSSPLTKLLEKADQALYLAKSGGRNRVAGERYQTIASQSGRPPIRSNLPTKLTSFFGRTAELDAIDCLMDQARALTITGTAGIGKTRVALRAAQDHLEKFPDGVWFVDLARVTDAALVGGSILYVLGDREERNTQPLATLIDYVGEKRMLILLDNCQRLTEECAALTEALLRKCPNAQIIATCRDTLRIRGEIAYRIPSLAAHDSADLFAARAREFVDEFASIPTDRRIIERIVRRVDGIPMAIELVAARLKVMTLTELDKRLDGRFPEPDDTSSTPRPHILSTVVDWSYGLLDDAEKTLIRRLAVFPGDWSMEASAEICADGEDEKRATLENLSRMVSKALLFCETRGGGSRYSMFETLHEFGIQLLGESGELGEIQRRHAKYYCMLAARLDRERSEPSTDEWVDKIEVEHHNFRAALEWSVLHDGDLEIGAGLATALAPWWAATSHFREGRYWIDHIVWRTNDESLGARLRSGIQTASSLIGSKKAEALQSADPGESEPHWAWGDQHLKAVR